MDPRSHHRRCMNAQITSMEVFSEGKVILMLKYATLMNDKTVDIFQAVIAIWGF